MSEGNAAKILAAIKGQIDTFYEMSGGTLDATTFLFSEMAEQPVPFPTVMELLGIPEEQAKREGPGVKATKEQFVNAVTQAIDEEDTVEQYQKVFESRINRMQHAKSVKADLSGPIQTFHSKSGGELAKVEKFFADLQPGESKGQPMPPGLSQPWPLLGIPEEQAKREGPGVKATKEQFVNAVTQAIDEEDTVEQYQKVFESRINRMQHAKSVKADLSGPIQTFHSKSGGELAKVEKFFADLQPGESKGQPMPPGLISALLRVPPTSKTCTFEQLLDCIERNLDPNDTAAKILEVLSEQKV
eukprot:CAMPEP_0180330458 /NCGR_PEP_ID=MMETSP0988-20121125/41348_1 /TAXON_ID=697907 /ORGANISM="non described non described, Strain CCMP2293" /LENGTH=300 /DNA_ID=CAMNT_0022317715 /DNA_START=44 /DNA_END=947 /DNA_ORIENTATION=+